MNQQIHWHTDWGNFYTATLLKAEFNLWTRTNLWQSFNAVVNVPTDQYSRTLLSLRRLVIFLLSLQTRRWYEVMNTNLSLRKASNVTGTTNQSWRLRSHKLLIFRKKEQPFSQCLSTYTICFVSFMNVYLKIKSWKQDSYQFPSKRRFSQRVAECKFTLQVYNSNNRWEINCHKGPLFRLWR